MYFVGIKPTLTIAFFCFYFISFSQPQIDANSLAKYSYPILALGNPISDAGFGTCFFYETKLKSLFNYCEECIEALYCGMKQKQKRKKVQKI